ncbi:MAG TPA: hypothetical protein VFO27_18175, partial [Bryobacteraceae bacterium]|nr:hypothetical protein [Bryobacteraceae bacterium]
EPSIFYERPWMGGKWGTRDAIDYMLTADFAILSHAAIKRTDYLLKSYEMARASIEAGEKGGPYAYIIAPEQWDGPTAIDMLERLSLAGIEAKRAKTPFRAGGKQYPAGTYVLPAAQPFRPYLMDLLEPQKYPELKSGAGGTTKHPYDIAGWTLSMQMGVAIDRVDNAFEVQLESVEEFRPEGSVRGSGPVILMDHRENASFLATAFFLERDERVQWADDGSILVDSAYVNGPARYENFARQFGVRVKLAAKLNAKPVFELKRPRVALYEPWVANPDEGWTEWLLERYRIPYTLLHNEDVRKPDLRPRFDTIILAAQSPESILHGFRPGETTSPEQQAEQVPTVTVQRPEYAGGIELAGLNALQQFVGSGGTLVALDTATELPMHYFPLSLKNVIRAGSDFYCPGSLIRLALDDTQPIAFGMPKEAIAFSTGGEAFDVTLAADYNKGEREIHTVARFEKTNLLASGWVSGAQVVAGKAALVDVPYGRGRVVLFAFRPQFRGQPFGTFKLLLNAIYLGSAQPL